MVVFLIVHIIIGKLGFHSPNNFHKTLGEFVASSPTAKFKLFPSRALEQGGTTTSYWNISHIRLFKGILLAIACLLLLPDV